VEGLSVVFGVELEGAGVLVTCGVAEGSSTGNLTRGLLWLGGELGRERGVYLELRESEEGALK